jgi:hypothetical protein
MSDDEDDATHGGGRTRSTCSRCMLLAVAAIIVGMLINNNIRGTARPIGGNACLSHNSPDVCKEGAALTARFTAFRASVR